MTSTIETYEQAIEYLFNRINYERVHADIYSTGDFKLDRMRQLLALLGDPHLSIPAVHIAGTKGKGSTAAMISEMISAAGLNVGLFTSPHIDVFEERIRFNGSMATPEDIVELVNHISIAVAKLDGMPGRLNPTYFEIATAMAWVFFAWRKTEVVVLEVGLGGRLDSTNLCNPAVTLITSISRDHTQFLGSSLSQIAMEKAGIVKDGVPMICGTDDVESTSTIAGVCEENNAPLFRIGHDIECQSEINPDGRGQLVSIKTPWSQHSPLCLRLDGQHQARNAALAVAAIDVLRQQQFQLPAEAIQEGLESVKWPLRIEVLKQSPTVVVDAAHNWKSIKELLNTLSQRFEARRRILIFSTSVDKDICGMLRLLLPSFDTVVLTQYQNNPRAVPINDLHQMARKICHHSVHLAEDPTTAWHIATRLSSNEDLICVTGSFFIAGEMREAIVDASELELTATQPAEHS